MMDASLDIRTGVKETMPTVFGYIGIALAFGIVGKAAGLSPLIVLLMSMFIYSGTAQFVVVSMFISHSPLLSIVLSTLLISSRMILISVTVAPYFKNDSLWKNILLGTFLTDESFALGMNKLNFTNHTLSFQWLNTANVISFLTWCFWSFVGAIMGNFVGNPEALGLDFAIVGMFIGLLYMQVIADRSLNRKLQLIVIAFTLFLTYVGFIFIPSSLLILVVTLIGCGFGVVIKRAYF